MSDQARYAREHYARNADAVKARARAWTSARVIANRQIVREAKSVPCADCNTPHPYYVMDFDHVRGVKDDHIANLVQSGVSEARLRAEIAKCEVVCANCHRERTHQRLQDAEVEPAMHPADEQLPLL